MNKLNTLNYGIVGLGIMGGSYAKSIKLNIMSENGSTGHIYASNRSKAPLALALKEGVIDKSYPLEEVDKMLSICDVVFICLYPHLTLSFLKEHKEAFKSGSIITDISGVKSIYIDKLQTLTRGDTDFIIGHPMAGGEREGYLYSSATFFIKHNYLLCPTSKNKKENLTLMESLISTLGFSKITYTTPDIHDYKIGFTSQLCHIIASSLVLAAEDKNITDFGGGSFEDLTRIAKINAPLWTELFLSNKKHLLTHIDNFTLALDKIKRLINTDDKEGLEELLEEVRNKRISMGSVNR